MPYEYVNGIRLRYETWGVGNTPLVFLHGMGSSADDWFLQLPALAPHFRCILVDLRGHGLSEKPAAPYSMQGYADDVACLLTAIGAAPAYIVGLSLGGMVAQQLAISYALKVRSLVLLNTLPGIWPPVRPMVALGVRRMARPWRRRSMAEQAAIVAADLFPAPEQATFRLMTEERLGANDPDAYRRTMMAIIGYRPGAALRRIACPVLIVAADDDRVVHRTYQQRLRASIPGATFVSVPGGHACNIDHAADVNAALLRFLLQLSTSERLR